jgi:hypothetical protein
MLASVTVSRGAGGCSRTGTPVFAVVGLGLGALAGLVTGVGAVDAVEAAPRVVDGPVADAGDPERELLVVGDSVVSFFPEPHAAGIAVATRATMMRPARRVPPTCPPPVPPRCEPARA